MNTITTLDELADFINSAEEWPLEAFDIIEKNGWNDETGETYGVCSDDTHRIILRDDGEAIVIDKDATIMTYYIQETIGGWKQNAIFSGTLEECEKYWEENPMLNYGNYSIVREDEYEVDYV